MSNKPTKILLPKSKRKQTKTVVLQTNAGLMDTKLPTFLKHLVPSFNTNSTSTATPTTAKVAGSLHNAAQEFIWQTKTDFI